MNILARFGEEYQLNEAFKKAALQTILTGNVLYHFEHWQTEKLSFDDLLRRVKEQARSHKLDADVSHGRTGVVTGTKRTTGPSAGDEESKTEAQGGRTQAGVTTDINAFGQHNRRGKGNGKGKGKWGQRRQEQRQR